RAIHVRRLDGVRQQASALPASTAMAGGLAGPPGRAAAGVHVIADGRESVVDRAGPPVAEILKEARITLRELDQVTPPLTTRVAEGELVRVVRVETREAVVEEKIAPTTIVRPPDAGRGPAHPTVTTAGKPGLQRRTFRIVLRDGVEAQR